MAEQAFISFIIPSYNSQDTILKCLGGIRGADYPKEFIEIIVVDNGSEDNTVNYAKQFANNVIIDAQATIAGLRNIGARNAKGDFLAFIDSDCVMPKDWIHNALTCLKDRDAGMTGSSEYFVPSGAGWLEDTWGVHFRKGASITRVKWLSAHSVMARRDAFFSVGGFDAALVTCEDVEFGYRMHKKYHIISSGNLRVLHLKCASSISDFFKKEVWRGGDSVKVSLRHINEPKEILSLLFVSYYLLLIILLIPAAILSFVAKNTAFFLTILSGLFVPLILLTLIICGRIKNFSIFSKMLLIYCVYALARVRAIFA